MFPSISRPFTFTVRRVRSFALVATVFTVTATASADEPRLPGGPAAGNEPAVPSGLSAPSPRRTDVHERGGHVGDGIEISGFVEARAGTWIDSNPYQDDAAIAETRLQLQVLHAAESYEIRLTSDLLIDGVGDNTPLELEEDSGVLQPRELSLSFRPMEDVDVKIGRQILTWGTGDFVFINDLFPKDFNAFFLGRDDENLKKPSDAIKVSLFAQLANLDVVYTPRFDADTFVDGSRLSYFNTIIGRIVGQNELVRTEQPNDWFLDDELAVRLNRNIEGYELALYGYYGFWKTPESADPVSGKATHPRLSVYGFSARGGIGRGIGNIELGYYDSRDDSDGSDPLVRNSEVRLLLGYQQELIRELTVGLQYLLEHQMNHAAYLRKLPAGISPRDENRHVVTLRLTQLLMAQDLTLSLFAFYSPSDRDAHLRPKVHYKYDDNLSFEAGLNLFFGKHEHTSFGQLKNNDNLYFGIRYNFAK